MDAHESPIETPPPNALAIGAESKNYLLEMTKWAKLFAVLGFIATFLIAIMALFAGSLVQLFSSLMGSTAIDGAPNAFESWGSGFSIMVTVFYLFIALLYFFPSLYLYNFAKKMKEGLLSTDNFQVEEGFKNLKSVFKFWGILTIIVLVIYVFSFFAGLMGSVFL